MRDDDDDDDDDDDYSCFWGRFQNCSQIEAVHLSMRLWMSAVASRRRKGLCADKPMHGLPWRSPLGIRWLRSLHPCELRPLHRERQRRTRVGGFRKRKHDNFPHSQRREGKDVSSTSPVMLAFKSFQQELDARHDKYERLVKLSRDITVESKRTIFLLHRITSSPDMEEILTESETKLDGVRQKILQVAQELSGEDMHQFHRAVTTGLQEYVEAVSFKHFIKTCSLISMEEINKQLTFTTEDSGKESKTPSSEGQDKQLVMWRLNVTLVDYLLGVADFTGELMRMCINSVGNGDIDTPFEVSQFLRQDYNGFSFIGNTGPYEVENACYALKVRGSEIHKHMLADVFSVKTEIIDQEESIS
ncbi:LOW QUALITY PROTEIN: translin-associated protein X-like [Acomys russatus]|uniref:LOW QUALITY PROTEIN: translin-associated protein X-like n=1 Tax=Acomys russatus TaxID=60746 RepID=UPI0021E20ED2|nr:LOW QUALITY PROTEIN: translin-associated protein X-like [Acomys russatus]